MGKNKKKNKITETSKPTSIINEDTIPEVDNKKGIIIDFSCPLSFYSCKEGDFTNYLKNPQEFIKHRRMLFGEMLEYFSKNNFDDLKRNSSSHTHIINDKENLSKIEKILKKLINIKWPDNNSGEIVKQYMESCIWQLGYKEGFRLIGTRNNNIFNLLFIDYHHLIFPSKKYNTKDLSKYKYCPMTSDCCSDCNE